MTVSVLGYGLKWQLAGSIAVLGLGVGGLLPTLAPQYVRRYYQKYDLNNQPLEVTDNSLMLLDDVSSDSLLRGRAQLQWSRFAATIYI